MPTNYIPSRHYIKNKQTNKQTGTVTAIKVSQILYTHRNLVDEKFHASHVLGDERIEVDHGRIFSLEHHKIG